MSILNERTAALFSAQMRAVHIANGHAGLGLPLSSSITALMKHGGIYTLTDGEVMTSDHMRLHPTRPHCTTMCWRSRWPTSLPALAPRPRHPQADATAQAEFSQRLDCN
jgi:hypothetical protein